MAKFPYKFDVDDVARTDERARKQAKGWIMKCPAHDDRQASLSVTRLDNGFAFFKCFTGCAQEDIAAALTARGLRNEWTEGIDREPRVRKTRKVVKVTHNIIRGFDGEALADHVRFDYEDGSKDFETNAPDGSKLTVRLADLLYGLELVAEFDDRLVFIVEGEKAADALRSIGVTVACGTLGASIGPSPALIQRFSDREVILWPDNDQGGKKQMEAWRAALVGIASKVVVVDWTEAPAKGDAYDWVAAGGTLPGLTDLVTAGAAFDSPAIPPGTKYLWQGLDEALKMLDRFSTGDTSQVIPSGIQSVDRAIRGGFEAGEVYLLGAPTGGGKTTIMQDFVTRIAGRGPVLFVTPEMTLASMALRALVRDANFEVSRDDQVSTNDVAPWRRKEDREKAYARLARSYAALAGQKLPIVIYDNPEVSMAAIEEVASKVRNLRAIVIDYAQQVAGIDGRMPRYMQVGEVATRSTVMAKRLNVPVLLASQVNRSTAKDDGGTRERPVYTFRESAMLEHKASVVMIFDRKRERDFDAEDEARVDCVLRCHKNRHGYLFKTLDLDWYPAIFQVQEPTQEERARRSVDGGPTLGPVAPGEREMSLVAVGDAPEALPLFQA